jgi:hypothetical protein
MLASQAHSIDIDWIRNTTEHSFFHVLLTLTALVSDENAGRNLAAPLRHKTDGPPTSLLFFWRRIAKRPHCFKFLAKFLLFLKKNSSNWGGTCCHKSGYLKIKKNTAPPPMSLPLFWRKIDTGSNFWRDFPFFSTRIHQSSSGGGGAGEGDCEISSKSISPTF